MDQPNIYQKNPIAVEVEAGKKYAWCACGHSQKQPFCDGAHKTCSDIRPVVTTFEEAKTLWFCGCKHTKNEIGLCDGSHKTL
ncbi:MAG: CDGSH iron-sulfur domain-containing protein [Sphingobacteriales bacterium]|nr:CDGSH iron-sulfur domain-containing protein [Sphingobacteriales bacterium]MCC7224999.1 CDGSH iron-sulfur domain-containing protein [Chitinophagales bacterium]